MMVTDILMMTIINQRLHNKSYIYHSLTDQTTQHKTKVSTNYSFDYDKMRDWYQMSSRDQGRVWV